MKFGHLPEIPQFRAWRNVCIFNVNSAGGRHDDEAIVWLLRAEPGKGTEQELASPGRRFYLLDKRIATGILKIAEGELGRQLSQAAEFALKAGRAIRGRELWRMVLTYYQASATTREMYRISDLQAAQILNGNLSLIHI